MTAIRIALLAIPLLAVACSPSKTPADNAAASTNAETSADTAATPEDHAPNAQQGNSVESALTGWIGRWNGPEGLFLDIQPSADGKPGLFALTLKDNLDSQAVYEGTAAGSTITFQRAGKTETIRAGTGAETGFKYLMEKKDCLIVQPGKEGYCRA